MGWWETVAAASSVMRRSIILRNSTGDGRTPTTFRCRLERRFHRSTCKGLVDRRASRTCETCLRSAGEPLIEVRT